MFLTSPPCAIGTSGGPDGPGGPFPPEPPDPGESLLTLPPHPARPTVAASASIANRGTRDRVLPRTVPEFIADSLGDAMT